MRRAIALGLAVAVVGSLTTLAIAQQGAQSEGDTGGETPQAQPGSGSEGTGAGSQGSASESGDGTSAESTSGQGSAQGSEGSGQGSASGTAGSGDGASATTETTGTTGSAGSGKKGETTTRAERDEGMSAGTYAVRLRDLEQRINELKEQIFRSKARLSLLAETVLQGVVAGSQAVIVHENRMSNSYKLVKAVYALDGAPIFNKADEEGGLGEQEEFQVYNGSIVPGEHTLTVNLEYRGHGFGIFSYLKGYRFKVRSNYSFTAPEGRAVKLRVIGYEKGGPTAPLEERPAVRYKEKVSARGSAQAGGGGQGEGEGDE
jgi:hypothetical protein